jgi:transposase
VFLREQRLRSAPVANLLAVSLPALVVPPYGLRKRQESISEEVKEIAWKAQHRLHKRYMRLAAAGKDKRKITTAVARELLGFIWAIGTRAETTVRQRIAA